MKLNTCFKIFTLLLTLSFGLIGCGSSSDDVVATGPTTFTVRIANIGADAIPTSLGTNVPAVFAPGAASVNTASTAAFFNDGTAATPGLEIMAEDGGGMLLAAEGSAVEGVISTVAFGVPEGAAEPGPLTPGNSYVFQVVAEPGDYLNFATMFVQSNDLFIAPQPTGIPLFNSNGTPRSEDITSEVVFWDAGTEVNEEPGIGPNQAPRQAGPNTGAEENGVVRLLNDGDFPLPPLASTVTITLTPSS